MQKNTVMLMLLVGIFLFVSMSGCSQHVGNFSGLAAGTYRPENINNSNLVGKDITGKACKSIILFIPTGYPKLDEAVSQATAKNNGDFMMNSRVYLDHWYIPLIYGETCWKVEGDVYKTNK